MADVAGFDVIVEVHKDTIVDAINFSPLPDPLGVGDIRLLGGRFSVDLPLQLAGVSPVVLSLIAEVTLDPLPQQSIARFIVTLHSGACTLAGRLIDHVAGTLTIDVPLVFQLMPGARVDDPWQILLQTPAAQATCQFDAATQAKIGAVLKPTDVSDFVNAVIQAVRQLLGPVIPIPVPLLSVVPGKDSNDPTQLSAVPVVAWIDSLTLGVFGYYRAAASGGSVSAKKRGDLDQVAEEFFYGLSPSELVTPSRRVAFLFSATGAHQVLLCPLIREGVVRPLRIAQQKNDFAQEISSTGYWNLLQAHKNADLSKYLAEELAKDDPTLQLLWNDRERGRAQFERALARAEARVQADVQKAINDLADMLTKAWLKTPASIDAIRDAVPPPCGTGEVEVMRQVADVPLVQSDVVKAMLKAFDILPGSGKLVAHYDVEAPIEVLIGDVKPMVQGEVEVTLQVAYTGAVFAHVNVLTPRANVEATGLTATLISMLQGMVPGAWQVALTFMAFVLQQQLQSMLDDMLGKANPVASTFYRFPQLAARAVDIGITPDSVVLFGIVARRPSYNVFNPALEISVDKSLSVSNQPAIDDSLHLVATEWGCPEVTFRTRRVFWNTGIRLRARPRDLALPIKILGWTIEIGNFTVNSVAHFSVADPRARWSGAPVKLATGVLALSGVTNHPDPPLTNVDHAPFPLGHLRSRTNIQATVTGSDDNGWSINFLGEDGNFFVRITVDAIDDDKIPSHGEAIVTIKGDELQLPAAYTNYRDSCDAKYKAYSELKHALEPPTVERATVLPGEAVSLLEQSAHEVRQLLQAGDPAALSRLEALQSRYGPQVLADLPMFVPALNRPQPR